MFEFVRAPSGPTRYVVVLVMSRHDHGEGLGATKFILGRIQLVAGIELTAEPLLLAGPV